MGSEAQKRQPKERQKGADAMWASEAPLKIARLQVGNLKRIKKGAIAQLGERLHGMQEVVGSIPSGSTIPSLKLIKIYKNPRA